MGHERKLILLFALYHVQYWLLHTPTERRCILTRENETFRIRDSKGDDRSRLAGVFQPFTRSNDLKTTWVLRSFYKRRRRRRRRYGLITFYFRLFFYFLLSSPNKMNSISVETIDSAVVFYYADGLGSWFEIHNSDTA